MKATPIQREALRQAITHLDTPERRERYRSGQFPRADKVRDLDKRYRWDLLWEVGGPAAVFGVFHRLNDAHIDTVLRNVVAKL